MNNSFQNLSKKKQNIVILVTIVATIALIIGYAIISTNINNSNLKKLFTESEIQYMFNFINENYGNGEEVHIISQDNEYLIDTKSHKKIGIQSTIVGYFDSQENAYLVKFAKYNKNSDKYFNGQIEHILTINNSDYKKENLSGYK